MRKEIRKSLSFGEPREENRGKFFVLTESSGEALRGAFRKAFYLHNKNYFFNRSISEQQLQRNHYFHEISKLPHII